MCAFYCSATSLDLTFMFSCTCTGKSVKKLTFEKAFPFWLVPVIFLSDFQTWEISSSKSKLSSELRFKLLLLTKALFCFTCICISEKSYYHDIKKQNSIKYVQTRKENDFKTHNMKVQSQRLELKYYEKYTF